MPQPMVCWACHYVGHRRYTCPNAKTWDHTQRGTLKGNAYPFGFFFFLKRERGAPGMDPPDVIELMTEPTSIRHYRSTGVAMPKPTRFHNDTSPLASCTTASAEGIRLLNTTSFRWFHIVQSVAKMRCHSAPLR